MGFIIIKQMLTPRKKHDGYAPIDLNKPTNDIEDGLHDSWCESKINEKKPTRQGQASSISINPRIISDATIGLSDGLTVPFALTAGLSALGDTRLVIYGGLAELIAGGISMGLGGYLGAKSETDAYHATLANVRSMVAAKTGMAAAMARATFDDYPFKRETLNPLVESLVNEPADMVEFLMHFHHRLDGADHTASREYVCGLTISLGYIFGGLVPLLPYLVLSDIRKAFLCSIIVMGLALFAFGWLKTALVGETSRKACFRGGVQMTILGGVAAGAAMGCVKAVGSWFPKLWHRRNSGWTARRCVWIHQLCSGEVRDGGQVRGAGGLMTAPSHTGDPSRCHGTRHENVRFYYSTEDKLGSLTSKKRPGLKTMYRSIPPWHQGIPTAECEEELLRPVITLSFARKRADQVLLPVQSRCPSQLRPRSNN